MRPAGGGGGAAAPCLMTLACMCMSAAVWGARQRQLDDYHPSSMGVRASGERGAASPLFSEDMGPASPLAERMSGPGSSSRRPGEQPWPTDHQGAPRWLHGGLLTGCRSAAGPAWSPLPSPGYHAVAEENERLRAVVSEMRREMDQLKDTRGRPDTAAPSRSPSATTRAMPRDGGASMDGAKPKSPHDAAQSKSIPRLEEVAQENRRLREDNQRLSTNCVSAGMGQGCWLARLGSQSSHAPSMLIVRTMCRRS